MRLIIDLYRLQDRIRELYCIGTPASTDSTRIPAPPLRIRPLNRSHRCTVACQGRLQLAESTVRMQRGCTMGAHTTTDVTANRPCHGRAKLETVI